MPSRGEPVGLDLRRLVLVRATRESVHRFGTGYFVTGDLVLTAGHVVSEFEPREICVRVEEAPERPDPWRDVGEIAWQSPKLDAALLRVAEPLPGDVAGCDCGMSQGRGDAGWESCGYPDASLERDREIGATRRRSSVLKGTLYQHGGRGQGDRELELTVEAPPTTQDWRGVSGAPVFVDQELVGILTKCPESFQGGRLVGLPAERLHEVERVRELVPALRRLRRPADKILTDGRPRSRPAHPITRNSGPARLLVAGEEVVPFFEPLRKNELEDLGRFCGGNNPLGVLLLLGPGGAGKTRLLIEWCDRLRNQGWSAGFLRTYTRREELQHDLGVVLDTPGPVLVALDYAETHPELAPVLQQVSEWRRHDPLRIVLAARGKGDWWQRLLERNAPVLEGAVEWDLSQEQAGEVVRRGLFQHAAASFSRVRGKNGAPPPPPDLADRCFGRPLYVSMAALAAVDDLDLGGRDVLQGILLHEESFWLRPLDGKQLSVQEKRSFTKYARQTIAGVTLLGGLRSSDDAAGLFDRLRIPEAHREPVLGVIHDVYPGDGPEAYVSALQPDLLGEALVHEVLADPNTSRDYLERVFGGSEEAQFISGFTVLGRIALARPGDLVPRKGIERLLGADVAGRALAALEAAIGLIEQTAFAPVGDILADALARVNPTALAPALESKVPKDTVSLRRVAAWAATAQLAALPRDEDAATLAERARLLNNLGNRQSALGQCEEALASTSEAVRVYRQLASRHPVFRKPLEQSLNALGQCQIDLGMEGQATATLVEIEELQKMLPR